MNRRIFAAAVAAFGAMAATAGVRAEDYPTRPIRIVVPFPAGSSTDIVARTIGQKLGERLGQPVVIDNKAGAGGNIGSQAVAVAAPDGYTLLVGTAANAVSATLYSHLGYDFVKDFAPITLTVTAPLAILANAAQPYSTVRELIAYSNAHPGELRFGSGGNGTINHLAGEMFNRAAGTALVHIPYKAGSAAVADLLGGQIELAIDSVVAAIPNIKAGRLKAIAVTSLKPVESLSGVPSVAESGVPGFEVVSWHGLLAPAGTPKAIVDRLNREFVAILRLPDVKDKLAAAGAVAAGTTPEEYASFIKREIAKWGNAVAKSGAKAD